MEPRRCYGCMSMVEEEICPHCGSGADVRNQAHQLPAGTILKNQFQVGRVLGQGGFGITYIGLDLNLDTVVAIKEFFPVAIVNRDVAQGLSVRLNAEDSKEQYEACRDRFLREARALAKLQDIREIVSVRSLFQENNTAYITMEYVQGADLRHLVRQQGGQMSVQSLFAVIDPTLRALNTVHKAGLVHRDISPDNIMVMPDGSVKLLDFGAVRSVGDEDASIDLSHSTEAILKHGFAPMEQYRSRGNMGPWTDEYGICATVYYCLTGKVPPDAPSRAMGEEDVDWSTVPGLQEHQRAALEKGMSMRAKDRFGDLEELRKALFEAPAPVAEEEKEAPEITSVTLKKKGRGGLIAAVLLLAALGAGAFWFMNRQPAEPVMEAAPVQTEPAETQPTETLPPETRAPETEPMETEMQSVDSESEEQPWKQNMLCRDLFSKMKIEKKTVFRVTFVDTVVNAPENAIDVSDSKNGTVLGWMEWDGGLHLIIAGEGGINGEKSSSSLFNGCETLKSVSFGGAYHTECATSLASMFRNCFRLETVDIENLDVSNVKNMSKMFCMDQTVWDNHDLAYTVYRKASFDEFSSQIGTSGLETLNMESWDTSNVEYMSEMFRGCNFLRVPALSEWDVSKVRNMEAMFHGCISLEELDLSGWNLPSLTDANYMFWNCEKMKKLNAEGWKLPELVRARKMFYGCSNLLTLDVSQWDMSNAVLLTGLFANCTNLDGLDVSGWNIAAMSSASSMFKNCCSLSDLNVSNWNLNRLSGASSMFENCSSLTELDVSNWNLSSLSNSSDMFRGCSELVKLDTALWNVSKVTNMHGMFADCVNLRDLDVRDWDVSKVKDMSEMFYNCSEYLDLDVYYWNISNVYSFQKFMSDGRQLNGRDWGAFFWDNDLK